MSRSRYTSSERWSYCYERAITATTKVYISTLSERKRERNRKERAPIISACVSLLSPPLFAAKTLQHADWDWAAPFLSCLFSILILNDLSISWFLLCSAQLYFIQIYLVSEKKFILSLTMTIYCLNMKGWIKPNVGPLWMALLVTEFLM